MGEVAAHNPVEHRPVPAYVVSDAVLHISASALRAALLAGLSVNGERNDPTYMASGLVSSYRALWAGAAGPHEQREVLAWVRATVRGIPDRLGQCFSFRVTHH